MKLLENGTGPTYLSALNQIALTELRAYEFYIAWAQATSNPDVERVMRIVSIRELEHASAFQQHIYDLGFLPTDGPHEFGPQCDEWLALFRSDVSDLEKFRGFGFSDPDKLPQDNFHDFLKDTTLDAKTGALLGRYIAEERESANMFLRVYAEILKSEKK